MLQIEEIKHDCYPYGWYISYGAVKSSYKLIASSLHINSNDYLKILKSSKAKMKIRGELIIFKTKEDAELVLSMLKLMTK
ncbi:MAG: hypothetical protein ACOCP8_03670 [archaeon]